MRYRLSALLNAWYLAWPVRVRLKQKIKILRSNSWTALRRPHLFDDHLQKRNLQKLAAMVEGKRIAVVGNAQYLLETDAGPQIETHDVVVRFNRGFVVAPTSQGNRTTILCVAADIAAQEIAAHCPGALIVYASPIRSRLNTALAQDSEGCLCLPLGDWRDLVRALGNERPSAGFILLDYLLHRTHAASVSIFGFDWKRTKSFYHKEKIRDWHSGEAERKLLLQWKAKHQGRLSFGNCPMEPP